jgi:hypothetical protein
MYKYTICVCGSVGSGTALKAGRSRVRVSMRSFNFFNLPNPSSLSLAPRVQSSSNKTEYQKMIISEHSAAGV